MTFDPTAFVQAGPLGFIAIVALAFWYAAREWTKGRRIDVEEARQSAVEEHARAELLADQLSEERDRRITQSRDHTRAIENYVRHERAYRMALTNVGVNPDKVVME